MTDQQQVTKIQVIDSTMPNLDITLQTKEAHRRFSVLLSTERNHRSDDMVFYGPFAHIRKTLDYSFHSNYAADRQRFQDSIIEDMLSYAEIKDVNGDVCTTPTDPWIVFTAGAMGAGKGHTIQRLVEKGVFPLLAFVIVDPDEVRRHLPEFSIYAKQCPLLAGELTRKEAGYVAEILTIAALQAGKNVMVDGSLRDWKWYLKYFGYLRNEFPSLRLAILHVTAPREAVFERAARRAKITGRVVPQETLELALEQVPKSVEILAPRVNYFCELNNAPDQEDIEIVTDETWENFQQNWSQTCAWVPGKRKQLLKSLSKSAPPNLIKEQEQHDSLLPSNDSSWLRKKRQSRRITFSVNSSTEQNYASKDMIFYGPNAHIRKTLDYEYHCNYVRERQFLQDSIIDDMLNVVIEDGNGNVCSVPADPWIVFAAGAVEAGQSYCLHELSKKGRFPLSAFVVVNPVNIRRQLPEFMLYADQCLSKVNDLTRKESGYISEILSLAAVHQGKNALLYSSFKDLHWYSLLLERLRSDFPHLRIAILYITTPSEVTFHSSSATVPNSPPTNLKQIEKQIEKSVTTLSPLADYYCELQNAQEDIQMLTEGETWESFQQQWQQTCAWVPRKKALN